MDDLFYLRGAVSLNAEVEQWFAVGDPLRALVEPWFVRLCACGPDVRTVLHDGNPTVCVDEAAFAYVAAFTTHASVGFFYGAFLPDPAAILEGSGKRMRHVNLRGDQPGKPRALERLIVVAYQDVAARLKAAAACRS